MNPFNKTAVRIESQAQKILNEKISLSDLPIPPKFFPHELEAMQKLRADMKLALERNDFRTLYERSLCVTQLKIINMILNKQYIHHKGLA